MGLKDLLRLDRPLVLLGLIRSCTWLSATRTGNFSRVSRRTPKKMRTRAKPAAIQSAPLLILFRLSSAIQSRPEASI
jgi:hypothetical protein